MAVCYRHPDRETGVSCSNCGNPICPDCMTPTPVGMRCPNCARQKTAVRNLRNIYSDPTGTYVLIAINVLMWLGMMASGGRGSAVYVDFVTVGRGIGPEGDLVGVAQGDWWRIVTGGFLHATNPIHILFNMYALYVLGTMLEPVLGHARFVALYFASLLAGSFGVLLVDPLAPTVGASGAVFGLMGAAFVFARARGVDPMRSGLGITIALNLLLTFTIPGLSIGGHLGGLIGGTLAALAMDRVAALRQPALPVLACAAIGLAAAVGAIAVAGGSGLG
jgi:membrane associated rhomboid family serine protease